MIEQSVQPQVLLSTAEAERVYTDAWHASGNACASVTACHAAGVSAVLAAQLARCRAAVAAVPVDALARSLVGDPVLWAGSLESDKQANRAAVEAVRAVFLEALDGGERG